ncbi:MAG: hypothetical protein A3H98_12510 [Bacteroidetes bacterium RIFCSPLOWO2_02_FULL_36_8]|nr:MAG: hypothetical protein A3H98_12510 [Bacteroidetes bacterium RIFCSPLOWO2_02_FULL_36_8]OFY69920.1 MAG: hypothetical protein A3G23_05530 [Bacteroidetes bacterium RIFCSPLOWO2_12_FULL_37_12]
MKNKPDDNFLNTLFEKKQELLQQVTTIDNTILMFGGEINPEINGKNGKNIINMDIPNEYDFNLTWEEKTMFALKHLKKEALVEEIVSYLKKLEPDEKEDILFKRVRVAASNLCHKRGLIEIAKKIGKKVVYRYK